MTQQQIPLNTYGYGSAREWMGIVIDHNDPRGEHRLLVQLIEQHTLQPGELQWINVQYNGSMQGGVNMDSAAKYKQGDWVGGTFHGEQMPVITHAVMKAGTPKENQTGGELDQSDYTKTDIHTAALKTPKDRRFIRGNYRQPTIDESGAPVHGGKFDEKSTPQYAETEAPNPYSQNGMKDAEGFTAAVYQYSETPTKANEQYA